MAQPSASMLPSAEKAHDTHSSVCAAAIEPAGVQPSSPNRQTLIDEPQPSVQAARSLPSGEKAQSRTQRGGDAKPGWGESVASVWRQTS